jgi:carbonic anhydrase
MGGRNQKGRSQLLQKLVKTTSSGISLDWLRHIKDVARLNSEQLKDLEFENKFDSLCELNIIEQVANVCNTSTVQKAWNDGTELSIHGWIYNINNGILKNLLDCITSNEQLDDKYKNI